MNSYLYIEVKLEELQAQAHTLQSSLLKEMVLVCDNMKIDQIAELKLQFGEQVVVQINQDMLGMKSAIVWSTLEQADAVSCWIANNRFNFTQSPPKMRIMFQRFMDRHKINFNIYRSDTDSAIDAIKDMPLIHRTIYNFMKKEKNISFFNMADLERYILKWQFKKGIFA
jgi:hypothetical protein